MKYGPDYCSFRCPTKKWGVCACANSRYQALFRGLGTRLPMMMTKIDQGSLNLRNVSTIVIHSLLPWSGLYPTCHQAQSSYCSLEQDVHLRSSAQDNVHICYSRRISLACDTGPVYSAPEQVSQLLKILIESFLSFKTVCCAYHLLF